MEFVIGLCIPLIVVILFWKQLRAQRTKVIRLIHGKLSGKGKD